ncbi:DUF6588 family protein [Zunongwangia sp. H14]|uniref:DUF6588 family protein n=1 Tax=Zunongwangia sp. H14 TaxID=3240792 RepID=UPI0035678F28
MKTFSKTLFVIPLLFSGYVSAQESNDVDLFIEDMLFLADAFASPASESAAYQGTAGWFTSAAALDKWQVDISVHGNSLFVPSSKKEVTINSGNFDILKITGANNAIIPTAFGGETDVQFEGEINYLNQTIAISGFDAIDGLDKSSFIYPFVQVNVGLPFETEVGVRALPNLEIDGASFSTYGIGLKHNISQYFRFNNNDDLQLATILSYNLFNVNYGFDPISVPEIVTFTAIDVNAHILMAEFMASKRYENFEIFGALAVAQSSFEYEFNGSGFALPLVNDELIALDDSEAQFKGDIGFNVYLRDFKISTMATAGKFFNLNIGLHFRI